MALKRMTSGEMIHTTQTWVDAKHRHHQLLVSVAEVAVLMSHLEKAHKTLLTVQPTADPSAAGRARTIEALDAQHDDLVRAIYALFQVQMYLTQQPSERELWQRLRDAVFPEGLVVVTRSYSDEAGQAALALARLSADDKKQLKAATIGKESMLGLIERYGQVAQKLGEAAIMLYTPTVNPSRADAAEARNQWIRVVHAVLAAIDMVSQNGDLVREVVAPLREVERRADRRRNGVSDPEPLPAPSPDPVPAPIS